VLQIPNGEGEGVVLFGPRRGNSSRPTGSFRYPSGNHSSLGSASKKEGKMVLTNPSTSEIAVIFSNILKKFQVSIDDIKRTFKFNHQPKRNLNLGMPDEVKGSCGL